MNWLMAAGLGLVTAGFLIIAAVALSTIFIDRPIHAAAVGCVVLVFVPICFGAGDPVLVNWSILITAALLVAFVVLQWLLWRSQKQQES
ncbi:MAG: hypothetical protein QXT46_04910 [Pyrobaculum sp.]